MKKKIAIIVLVVASLLAVAKAWLNSEVKKVQWAIELAGGMNALVIKDTNPPAESEKLYLKTPRVTIKDETVKKLKS